VNPETEKAAAPECQNSGIAFDDPSGREPPITADLTDRMGRQGQASNCHHLHVE
jgi:hypothetical protein